VVPPAVLQFRKWLTIWADEPAKLKDANEKKRYAAILEHGLKRKLKNQGSGPAIKPDWKVALEKELKDQGVAPLSKTGLAATQRARRASRSVEQKTADNVREAASQKARRANRSVEQKTAGNVRAAATQKAAYWAVQNGVRCAWLGRCVCCRQQTERQQQQQ
jgi:hypothetical protein